MNIVRRFPLYSKEKNITNFKKAHWKVWNMKNYYFLENEIFSSYCEIIGFALLPTYHFTPWSWNNVFITLLLNNFLRPLSGHCWIMNEIFFIINKSKSPFSFNNVGCSTGSTILNYQASNYRFWNKTTIFYCKTTKTNFNFVDIFISAPQRLIMSLSSGN